MSKMCTSDEIFKALCSKLAAANLVVQVSDEFKLLADDRARLEFAYQLLQKFELFPNVGAYPCGKKNDKECERLRIQAENENENTQNALELLTRAIANGLPNSESLGKAYIARSELLYKLRRFAECVENLDRAFKCDNMNASQIQASIHEYQALVNDGKSKKPDEQTIPKLTHNVNARIACAGDSVRINKSLEHGRFVIATKDIEIGDVIAVEQPYAAIVLYEASISSTHCQRCMKMCYALIPCDYCTFAFFCSDECKQYAWDNFHQFECPITDTLIGLQAPKLSLAALRVALQALPEYGEIHKYSSEDTFEEETYESARYKEIHNLIANTDFRSVADLFKRAVGAAVIYDQVKRNTSFFKIKDKKEEKHEEIFKGLLLKHMQTAPSNFHEISEKVITVDITGEPVEAFCDEIGAGAYSFLSIFNHSCAPNVVRHCYGPTIVTRALCSIKKGEQLFDNYGYHYAVMPKNERLQQLKAQYLFDCQCRACSKNWPMYDELRYIDGAEVLTIDEIRMAESMNVDTASDLVSNLKKKAVSLEKLQVQPCKNLADVQECIKECFCVLGNKRIMFK